MTEYPLCSYPTAEILIQRSAKHGYLLHYKLQSVTSSSPLFAPQRIGSDSVWVLIASFTLTKGDTSRPLTWDKGSVSFNSEGGLEGGKAKITGVNRRQTLIIVSTEITNGSRFRVVQVLISKAMKKRRTVGKMVYHCRQKNQLSRHQTRVIPPRQQSEWKSTLSLLHNLIYRIKTRGTMTL